jgi:hypothetical protein
VGVPTGDQGVLEIVSEESGTYLVGITDTGIVDLTGVVKRLPNANPVVVGKMTMYTFQVNVPAANLKFVVMAVAK